MRTFTWFIMLIVMGVVLACDSGLTAEDYEMNDVVDLVAEAIQSSEDNGLIVWEICTYNNQQMWLTWDREVILIYKDNQVVSRSIRFDNLSDWSYEFQVTNEGVFQIKEIAYGGHNAVVFADFFGKTLSVQTAKSHRRQWRFIWNDERYGDAIFCDSMMVGRLLGPDGNVSGFNYACDTEHMIPLPGPDIELSYNHDNPPWSLQHLATKP